MLATSGVQLGSRFSDDGGVADLRSFVAEGVLWSLIEPPERTGDGKRLCQAPVIPAGSSPLLIDDVKTFCRTNDDDDDDDDDEANGAIAPRLESGKASTSCSCVSLWKLAKGNDVEASPALRRIGLVASAGSKMSSSQVRCNEGPCWSGRSVRREDLGERFKASAPASEVAPIQRLIAFLRRRSSSLSVGDLARKGVPKCLWYMSLRDSS